MTQSYSDNLLEIIRKSKKPLDITTYNCYNSGMERLAIKVDLSMDLRDSLVRDMTRIHDGRFDYKSNGVSLLSIAKAPTSVSPVSHNIIFDVSFGTPILP